MLATIEKNQKDIELLYKASDKTLLSKALSSEGKTIIPTVKIALWGDSGKHVVGWGPMVKNIAEIIMGRPVEDQVRQIFLEDGEELTVPYLESVRRMNVFDKAEILSKQQGPDGIVEFKVQFANGKILLIKDTFVNSK